MLEIPCLHLSCAVLDTTSDDVFILQYLCWASGAGESKKSDFALAYRMCFSPLQRNDAGTLLAIPEDVNRAPSADLRDYFRYFVSTLIVYTLIETHLRVERWLSRLL